MAPIAHTDVVAGDFALTEMPGDGLPEKRSDARTLTSGRNDGLLRIRSDALATDRATLRPPQVLFPVSFAGVLLPCLVTAFTFTQEHARYAVAMMLRQAGSAGSMSGVDASGALF